MKAESDKGHDKRLEFEHNERIVLKRAGYKCQARLEGCQREARTAHHKKLRSQGGGNELSNLLPVCRTCHKRLHNHSAEAARVGHIIRRTGKVAS